jgi:ribonucleoside-diphosphate reductase alpha chain
MNLNIWNVALLNKLKLNGGSVQGIDEIPAEMQAKYKTAFEIDPMFLVRSASARQKWIDQAQSLNIYMAQPSGKKLHDIYMNAWKFGLKTTYYLRSLGATSAEKSTVTSTTLNAVKACSITDPDCDACQ